MLTTGYIIDMYGPFTANTNYASILNIIIQTENSLKCLLMNGDTFVFDCGFRDAIHFLQTLGFNVSMPVLKNRNEKKLTADESNNS